MEDNYQPQEQIWSINDPQNKEPKQQTEKQVEIKKVLMIGQIGSGKSSTCQSICDFEGDAFQVSAEAEACTKETQYYKVKWKNTQDEFMLIDTPGFNEGEKEDEENLNNMIIRLSKIKTINAIFIVICGQNPRINHSIKEMLKLLHKIFQKEFLAHIAFIITRWSYREQDIEDREEQNNSEEKRTNALNSELVKLGIRQETDEVVQCYFVNNMVGTNKNKKKIIQKNEIDQHQAFLQQVRAQVLCLEQFECCALNHLIKTTESLQNQIAKNQEMFEIEKQKYQLAYKHLLDSVGHYKKILNPFQFEKFKFSNILGECNDCLDPFATHAKKFCNVCDNFLQNINKFENNNAQVIIKNFKILRPENQYFPLSSGIIKKITYYYSSKIKDISLNNLQYRYWSLMSKLTRGKWLLHSFLVFDYQDENQEGKLSIEFRPEEGFVMRLEEQIFEQRNSHKSFYEQEGNQQTIQDLMDLCAEYSIKNDEYDNDKNHCMSFTDTIWNQFLEIKK